jgi:hypothetical protein
MNKDAETNAQRQSYNVTSRTIQVSNRAVYNNKYNNNNSNNINEVNKNNDNNTSLI